MVPYALNQRVDFVKDKGPILEEFNFKKFLNNDKISFTQKLIPIYKAIQNTRRNLIKKIINCFCGSTMDFINLHAWSNGN